MQGREAFHHDVVGFKTSRGLAYGRRARAGRIPRERVLGERADAAAAAPPPAQTPPPAQAQASAAQEDPLKLKGDMPVIIINQIAARRRPPNSKRRGRRSSEKLAKSDKPELKAFGDTLSKMYRVSGPG